MIIREGSAAWNEAKRLGLLDGSRQEELRLVEAACASYGVWRLESSLHDNERQRRAHAALMMAVARLSHSEDGYFVYRMFVKESATPDQNPEAAE